eukprot:Opistho-2@49157
MTLRKSTGEVTMVKVEFQASIVELDGVSLALPTDQMKLSEYRGYLRVYVQNLAEPTRGIGDNYGLLYVYNRRTFPMQNDQAFENFRNHLSKGRCLWLVVHPVEKLERPPPSAASPDRTLACQTQCDDQRHLGACNKEENTGRSDVDCFDGPTAMALEGS